MSSLALGTPLQNALLPAGPQAEHIHTLWNVMLAACGIVFLAIVIALVVILVRTPRGTAATPPAIHVLRSPERGAKRIVVVALTVSILGLIALLVASVLTDRSLAGLPLADVTVIEVTARDWWWEAKYEDDDRSQAFITANELHVPVGRPVLIKLASVDVIHSLWVPNLAGKKDLIPGHTATVTLRADQPGIYRGQCAEFCGEQHAYMALLVIADKQQDYERWTQAQRQSSPPPNDANAQRGLAVFLQGSCPACHTIRGTQANGTAGPDLTHVASRRTLAAGTVPNTIGYLAGWIVDPQGIKPGANMPPNALAPEDLQALIAYLETLK